MKSTLKWDERKENNWVKTFAEVRPNPNPRLVIFIRIDGHPRSSIDHVQKYTDFDIDEHTNFQLGRRMVYRMIQWSELNNRRDW